MLQRAQGPDVSFYQDNDYTPDKINFQLMRNRGADFVFMRVGQNTWIDPDWKDYEQASKKVDGLLRGSYWFYDSRNTIQSQTGIYWNNIKDASLDIMPVMDFEKHSVKYIPSSRWSRTFFLSLIKEFLDRMDQHWGDYSMLYTNPGWLHYLQPLPDWLTKHPLWIAYYGAEQYINLWGYPEWKFWQHTYKGDGLYWGVESKQIDLNIYNGTRQDLKKWLDISDDQSTQLPQTIEERLGALERKVARLETFHK